MCHACVDRLTVVRLCVHIILCMCPSKALLVMATVCSSWSSMNVGTSRRSILLAEGYTKLPYVSQANQMMSRTHDQMQFSFTLFDSFCNCFIFMVSGNPFKHYISSYIKKPEITNYSDYRTLFMGPSKFPSTHALKLFGFHVPFIACIQ